MIRGWTPLFIYNEGVQKAPFGRRRVRTVGDTPTQWRVAPSLITLTNDYANYMIKLMIITNISQHIRLHSFSCPYAE
jgi:hypothetical protein